MKYHILHWVYVGVAALLVTCMAAVHGVMGESLFEIGSQELRKFWLLPVSLVAFVLCAWALWHREHIEHKIKHKTEAQKPPRHHRLTLAIAIGLLAMTALAQGLTAISMGHLAGEQLHHDYQVMLAVGGIAFLLLTLSLWRLKDKLFTIVAEVKDVEAKSWAFHASVIILSSPGDSELDIAQFKQAQNKFDAIWDDTKDWTKAIKALTVPEDDPKLRWNFQQVIRLLSHMALETKPDRQKKRRLILFLTSEASDPRYPRVEAFLNHIVSKMPRELGPPITVSHARDTVLKGQKEEDILVENTRFVEGWKTVRAVLAQLVKEFDRDTIAVDITTGTKEHSVVMALSTIDSHVAFTYVNTNDLSVRRFDARAEAVGAGEA